MRKTNDSPLVAVSPKIDQESAKWIQGVFPTLNSGATFWLNTIVGIYQSSLAELRGVLSTNELTALLNIFNKNVNMLLAYQRNISFLGYHIPLALESTYKSNPDAFIAQWGITDIAELVGRISKLPLFHRIVLEVWIAHYWNSLYQSVSIEEYCQTLAQQPSPAKHS
jgi:hypothetical protein